MAKEWILNSAMNRFQLNFKRNVGAVAEEIRKCSPKSVTDWRDYYFKYVYPKTHLVELGKKLFIKITEVLSSEITHITEQDCIEFIQDVVINRTFDGYTTEITTIYGQLQNILNITIEPAPDTWDRLYNIDFFIKINDKYIGLQIKPISSASSIQIPEIYKEKSLQQKSHNKFKMKFGGNVFFVYSIKENNKKKIYNIDVIDEIQQEMNRLKII